MPEDRAKQRVLDGPPEELGKVQFVAAGSQSPQGSTPLEAEQWTMEAHLEAAASHSFLLAASNQWEWTAWSGWSPWLAPVVTTHRWRR